MAGSTVGLAAPLQMTWLSAQKQPDHPVTTTASRQVQAAMKGQGSMQQGAPTRWAAWAIRERG